MSSGDGCGDLEGFSPLSLQPQPCIFPARGCGSRDFIYLLSEAVHRLLKSRQVYEPSSPSDLGCLDQHPEMLVSFGMEGDEVGGHVGRAGAKFTLSELTMLSQEDLIHQPT